MPDTWVGKLQLAQHPAVRRSTRWVEQQVKAGLPSELVGGGNRERRLFHLPTALAWIAARNPKLAERNAVRIERLNKLAGEESAKEEAEAAVRVEEPEQSASNEEPEHDPPPLAAA